MSKKIGVIAEDRSDVDVVNEILKKYLEKDKYTIKKFVGNGCGKLRNKCGVWASLLLRQGCDHIFLFHDRDRNCEVTLRKSLEEKVGKGGLPASLIVIPIEEMEAWLLSDVGAIAKVFSLKKTPKSIANSEEIISPKERLRDLVWMNNEKKRYLNTVHNVKIAEKLRLKNLMKCRSFVPFDEYLRKNVVV